MNRQNPIQNLSKTPYPFGMHMQGRSFSSGSYRYRFNIIRKNKAPKYPGIEKK
jgi:hypothetical protein